MKWLLGLLGLMILLMGGLTLADVSVSIQQPTNTTYNDSSRVLNYTLSITSPHNTTGYVPIGCSYTLNGNTVSLPSCTNTTFTATVGINTLNVSATFSNGTNITTNTTARNFTISFTFVPIPGGVTTTRTRTATILEDTFASDDPGAYGCGGLFTYNSTFNYGNETKIAMFQKCWTGISGKDLGLTSLWKYNISAFHENSSAIIQTINWNTASTGIAGCTLFSLFYVADSNSWNESNVTWLAQPTILPWGSLTNNIVNVTANVFNLNPMYATTDVQIDPSFVMLMYNSSEITLATSGARYLGCTANVGFTNYHYGNSKEGTDNEILNATVTDFLAGSFNYPKFSVFNPYFYWNFESGSFDNTGAQSSGGSSDFPEAEFRYQTDNGPGTANLIIPQNGVTMAYVRSDTTIENNLINTDCANAGPYSTYPFGWNVNVQAPNTYDVLCFNLTSLHAGRTFYAALKVTNAVATGLYPFRNFGAYWAMYDGSFTGFSLPVRNPSGDTISPFQNVTETWTTTQPTTTGYQYWEVINGVPGPTTNFQDTNFTTLHTFTIPADKVRADGIYHVQFFGTTPGGQAIPSSFEDVFNVSGGAGELSGNLIDIVSTANGGSNGLIVALFNEQNIPTGGYVSIDGYPAITTTAIECPNCTWTITGGYLNITIQRPWVRAVTYTPDIAYVGTHTIAVTDFAGTRTYNATFNIPSLPYALPVRLTPTACIAYAFWANQDFCEERRISLNLSSFNVPKPTGQFCLYNPTECQYFNESSGNCIQYARHVCTGDLCAGQTIGGWIQYVCWNNANSQYYNQTLPSGTVIPGTGGTGQQQGSVVPSFTNPLEQILGMTTEQILAMLSLIISIAVGIFAGAKTKDGMTAVVVIIVMIFLFTLVGWLPFWVVFVLAILAAFIVARFARGFLAGGGGH